jgi:anthranilate/para-aminobenzoate synthase component I
LHEALRAALPSRAAVGAPAGDALRLVRQLEDASRQTWGGAVGVVAPGGASSFLLGDEIVAVQHGAFWCTAGAGVTETSEPLRVGEETRGAVAARLHAIAVAHATALL